MTTLRRGLAAATRIVRARQRLSRAEVAKRAGLSENFVGAVETRRANPTISRLVKLAEGLGVQGGAIELLVMAEREGRKISSGQLQQLTE